jgi:Ran GTPase-activating protein (RanGAP) involved in mRNA processing and transport
VKNVVEAVKAALQDLKEGRELHPSVMLIPAVGCSLDRTTQVAKNAAVILFPPNDSESKDLAARKTWSYIRYSKIISAIRSRYKGEQRAKFDVLQKAQHIEDRFRLVRMVGQEELFQEMLDSSPGDPVLHPEPMPVNVPPLDDFKPFFCHMRSKAARPADQIEFKRGVFYSDGRIDMCKQVVGPPWISKLMDSIATNEEVTHFLLGNNIIGMEGASAISNFITLRNPAIETWYLAGNRLDANGITIIAEALKGNQHAKALWLKRNPLMVNGVKAVADMLTQNDQIEILDLDNTGMMDEGCEYLFDKLLQNQSLRLLYMDANNITPRGCRAIAKYFKALKQQNRTGLTSLFMGMNPLKDEGVCILAEALRGYAPLERLTLSSTRMTGDGLAFLLDSICQAPNLIMLDVGHYKSTADMKELPNCVGLKGAEAIAHYIEKDTVLKVLDTRTIHIPVEGLQLIAQSMPKNGNLLYVYPEQYGLRSPESRKALAEIRKQCNLNCVEKLGISMQEFCSKHLRFLKHTDRVQYIDSIYRNAC